MVLWSRRFGLNLFALLSYTVRHLKASSTPHVAIGTSSSPPWQVGLLLYGSGLCALIYQTVWLREFRLIFGASTAASAAILAVFMGGPRRSGKAPCLRARQPAANRDGSRSDAERPRSGSRSAGVSQGECSHPYDEMRSGATEPEAERDLSLPAGRQPKP